MSLKTIENAVNYPVSLTTIVYKHRFGDRVSSNTLMQDIPMKIISLYKSFEYSKEI